MQFPTAWLHEPLELHARLSQRGPKAKSRPDQNVDLIAAVRSVAAQRIAQLSFSAEDAAQVLGLDTRELQRGLGALETSASAEHKWLRLEHAKSALADNTLSIGEIARSLGYDVPAHFTRFFKSQTGLSPRKFRSKRSAQGD